MNYALTMVEASLEHDEYALESNLCEKNVTTGFSIENGTSHQVFNHSQAILKLLSWHVSHFALVSPQRHFLNEILIINHS